MDASLTDDEKQLLIAMLSDEQDLSVLGESRRNFLKQLLAAGGGLVAMQLFGNEFVFAEAKPPSFNQPPPDPQYAIHVSFTVNSTKKSVSVDARTTLLDALRDHLHLTGTKKGCDHGQCGACTVIVNNRRIISCLTLAATCKGKSVETIEGLATNGNLHPVQAAFLKHDGFQCGFCTPGQICSGVALIKEARNGDASYQTTDLRTVSKNLQLSDDEIRERMSGNICRCGAYANIIAAIKEVLSGKDVAQNWPMVPQLVTTNTKL